MGLKGSVQDSIMGLKGSVQDSMISAANH